MKKVPNRSTGTCNDVIFNNPDGIEYFGKFLYLLANAIIFFLVILEISILSFIIFLFYTPAFPAGTNSSDKDGLWNTGKDNKLYMKGKNSNFKKATDAVKQAKRYAKKKSPIKQKIDLMML